MTIPVIIEKCATGAPAALGLGKAGYLGNIGEGSVSVVMEQDVMSPESAEKVVPSVVVVVAYAHAGLPSGARQTRLFRNIGKGAVAVVLVEVRCRLGSGRPLRVEPIAIAEIDVEPAVVVVVEESHPAALGLDDRTFVLDSAPDIGDVQPCF